MSYVSPSLAPIVAAIEPLTSEQKRALLDAIYEQLERDEIEEGELKLSDELRAHLDARWAAYQANRSAASPARDVVARLKKRFSGDG